MGDQKHNISTDQLGIMKAEDQLKTITYYHEELWLKSTVYITMMTTKIRVNIVVLQQLNIDRRSLHKLNSTHIIIDDT